VVVILPSPISKLQHALLPLKVLQAKEHAATFDFSVVFILDSHLSLFKSLGAHKKFFNLNIFFVNDESPINVKVLGNLKIENLN
jgi:hypothetical protein